MIGLIWQFMHLTKSLLANAGYSAGVRFLVNLIGTRDTLLSDFSRETGKGRQKWLNPFEPAAADSLHKLRCPDTNLQMEYKFVLGNLDKEETEKIIRDIAQQFSLAYNHQSQPRCFTFGTETFPWDQYLYDSQFVM
jgi:hypothetical protein